LQIIKGIVQDLNNISVTVIDRSASLRNNGSPIPTKKLALKDLFRKLHSTGLSYLTSNITPAQKEQLYLLRLPIPEVYLEESTIKNHVIKDKGKNEGVKDDISLIQIWQKADDYFYKCLIRIQNLRNWAGKYCKDLTSREVQVSSGYVEFLLNIIIEQRTTFSSSTLIEKILRLFVSTWSSSHSFTFPPQSSARSAILFFKGIIDQTVGMIENAQLLQKAISVAPISGSRSLHLSSSISTLKSILSTSRSIKIKLDKLVQDLQINHDERTANARENPLSYIHLKI